MPHLCPRKVHVIGSITRYLAVCRRPVLIFGEPGLEKDNIAAQIHYRSSKHLEWPISRLDCAKLDSHGSQLFGRGSKQGLLHWAGEGTLLLTNLHKVRRACLLLFSLGGFLRSVPVAVCTCGICSSLRP